jgi:transcription initiation factor IIE alpha subunit
VTYSERKDFKDDALQKRRTSIEDMPPAAQVVYHFLQAGEELNTMELEYKTQYSPRSVRYALRYLIEANLIIQMTDINDARRRFYVLKS